MTQSLWQAAKEEFRATLDLIAALDERTNLVIEEGLALLWQDIRSFFAE